MENKNKFWKGVLVGSFVTAFAGLIIVGLSAGIFLIGKTVIRNQASSQITELQEGTGGLDIKKIADKTALIQSIIDEYYLFDEDTVKVEEGMYTGLMYGLEDPYSSYFPKQDLTQFQEDTEGVYCGIGVMVTQSPETGAITVVKVFENSPSAEAGILADDIIYKVSGEETAGTDMDIVISQKIKGKEGTTVDITVFRESTGEYIDMTVERRTVEVSTVESKMLDAQTGYIVVTQFGGITAEQFKKAVDDLQSQGMQRLVIDLRDNPGGVLESAVSMLDYILPDGLLTYTADKNGNGDKFYSKDGHEVDIPMAILVNGNSASASEVFAGAIRDFNWGKLVGTTTFGKGIVQNLIPLGDGTAIKLTVAHYYTPSGFNLHGKGLEPDVVVELDESVKGNLVIEPEEDNQLQEALKLFEAE